MGERQRSRFATATAVELPEQLPGLGIVGVEVAVAFTGKGEAAGSGERSTHHGLRYLVLPGDLAGSQIDGGKESVLLLTRDGHERGSEPQFPLLPGCAVRDVVHRLMQGGYVSIAQRGIYRDGRPLG